MATVGENHVKKSFFRGLNEDPDSSDTELMNQRLHQRRPLTRNPFIKPKNSPELEFPVLPRRTSQATDEKDSDSVVIPKEEEDNKLPILKNPGPTWVYLFYDLAWTATFSTLTANGQLNEPWDSASYVGFFTVVWWMWASQVLYSVNFYTNDWFHLVSIFLQLIIFGMLAATTRGFDITNYIIHSPGMTSLDPKETDQIFDPNRYSSERLAKVSMKVIAISMAISRVLLLLQYLRVLFYAHWTVKNTKMRAPWWKLCIIPVGLLVSTPLFFAAWAVARSSYGRTHRGAQIKFILWGVGLLVEFVSHIRMSRISWLKPNNTAPAVVELSEQESQQQTGVLEGIKTKLIVPYSNVKIRVRLEAITTIILGEGINGIAGTLYSVISTPTLGGPIVSNVACSALIVYFLAYLYFEGSTGHRELKERGRRQVYWVLLHLPFLLCVVLLLQGVKSQFLLTSFLSAAESSYNELDKVSLEQDLNLGDPDVVNNLATKNYFLRRGLSWANEYSSLINQLTRNGSVPLADDTLSPDQVDEFNAWNVRISFKIILETYKTFMGSGDAISKTIQEKIDSYNHDLKLPLEDWNNESDSLGSLNYYQILTELLSPKLQNTRYIMAIAGLVLIFMAILDLVHSRPRDRFQWGSILSRFSMGWALIFLLLLNLGRYQTLWVYEDQINHQAGVFLWLSAYWVLPTITIAFGIQFIIDIALVWFAVKHYAVADPSRRKRVGMRVWARVGAAISSCFDRRA